MILVAKILFTKIYILAKLLKINWKTWSVLWFLRFTIFYSSVTASKRKLSKFLYRQTSHDFLKEKEIGFFFFLEQKALFTRYFIFMTFMIKCYHLNLELNSILFYHRLVIKSYIINQCFQILFYVFWIRCSCNSFSFF